MDLAFSKVSACLVFTRWLRILTPMAVVLAIALSGEAATNRRSPPRFEEYPVKSIFRGRARPVNLNSDPDAYRFRTRLRKGAIAPPDFAGYYRIVMWGCGTMCQIVNMVDLRSGRVYFLTQSELGVRYRVNSRLFVVNPPEELRGFGGGYTPRTSY